MVSMHWSCMCIYRRPETSFLWFTSPWKTLRYIIWRNYKWYFIGFLVLLLILLLVFLFLYSFPVSISAIGQTYWYILRSVCNWAINGPLIDLLTEITLCGLYGLKFQHKLNRENYINVYYLFIRRIYYIAGFPVEFWIFDRGQKIFLRNLKILPKIGNFLFCREKFLNGLSMDRNCHKPQTPWIFVISGQQRTKNDKLYTL